MELISCNPKCGDKKDWILATVVGAKQFMFNSLKTFVFSEIKEKVKQNSSVLFLHWSIKGELGCFNQWPSHGLYLHEAC